MAIGSAAQVSITRRCLTVEGREEVKGREVVLVLHAALVLA